MPVPISQLHEEAKPTEQLVSEFLTRNRGQAFDIFEIGAAVQGTSGDATAFTLAIGLVMMMDPKSKPLGPLQTTLDKLVKAGQITKGLHQGRDYYGAE